MNGGSGGSSSSNKKPPLLKRMGIAILDRSTLWPKTRWLLFFSLLSFFAVRCWQTQGFFVVIYALAIYLLNLLIGFLSPQYDAETDNYVLPVREAEEFRPFQRRLPEFKAWTRGTAATLCAVCCTYVPLLDLPVFWPVLLVYFLCLFFMTIKQQVKHMIKHRYIPISWGKQTYGDITRNKNGRLGPTVAAKSTLRFPSVKSKSPNLAS